MSIRLYRDIARRKSRKIRVGIVEVGGDAHITVQSMTNTLTTDIQAAIRQLKGLEAAGADIVRISCPNEDSTLALKSIVSAVAACLRINPGNIGSAARGGGQRANLIFC